MSITSPATSQEKGKVFEINAKKFVGGWADVHAKNFFDADFGLIRRMVSGEWRAWMAFFAKNTVGRPTDLVPALVLAGLEKRVKIAIVADYELKSNAWVITGVRMRDAKLAEVSIPIPAPWLGLGGGPITMGERLEFEIDQKSIRGLNTGKVSFDIKFKVTAQGLWRATFEATLPVEIEGEQLKKKERLYPG